MKKFAVIGSPISHSISPKIYSEFARNLDLEISYEAIEIQKDSFIEKTRKLLENDFDGLNVTLPLKELAFQLAEEVTQRGKDAKAVNTLWKKNGKIHADTTDGAGLIQDLNNNAISLKGSSILLVGAGGSAKSILPNLINMGPEEVTIINRTEGRAKKIVALFNKSKMTIKTSSLQKNLKKKFNGIINTSSAGLLGEDIILPEGIFNSVDWVYDLSYSKNITPFNFLAKESGVKKCLDGLGMLVHQAAYSFEIWTGKKADPKNTIKLLRISL